MIVETFDLIEHTLYVVIIKKLIYWLNQAYFNFNNSDMNQQNLVAISKSFFIDPEYKDRLRELGLTSIDEVFSCTGGKNLEKKIK